MAVDWMKFGVLFATAGGIATFAVPMFLAAREEQALTEEFSSVLPRYQKMTLPGKGKNGKLSWPKTIADLDRSQLPTIPGGVFVMVPGKTVPRLNNTEDIPPKIHDAFFEIDEAIRARNRSDIRTVVQVQVTAMTEQYVSTDKNNRSMRLLNQKVAHVHLFDVQNKVYLGSWILEGQMPPRSFRSDDPPSVAPPPSIARFLEALPRR